MSALPKGWASVPLGQTVTFKTGPFGSALHKSDYIFDGIPLINPTHIKDGRLISSKDVTVSDDVSSRLKDYALLNGDVVMGRRGEMGRCAVVTESEQGWLCGTGSVIVRSNGAVNAKYLQRFLSSPSVVSTLNGDSVGSTMVNLNQGVLLGLDIQLAPLPEQKRIADKLDATLARVDACRERLARVAPILKRFRQSVLAAATCGQLTADWREQQGHGHAGDDNKALQGNPCVGRADEGCPTSAAHGERWASQAQPNLRAESPQCSTGQTGASDTLPFGWQSIDIQSVASVGTGSTPLRSNDAFFASSGVPWVTSAATGNEFVHEASEYVTEAAIKAHRLKLYPISTLLVAMYGEGKTRGQVAELAIEATINQACAAVVVDEEKALRAYVKLALQANYLEMRALAEGGNQPNLNLSKVKEFAFLLPPLAEQTEIVRRVETLFAFADRLEARLASASAAAERLTPSLLAKAFRGELVSQDPNDEPASELLKRLAAQREAMPKAKRGKKSATAAGTA